MAQRRNTNQQALDSLRQALALSPNNLRVRLILARRLAEGDKASCEEGLVHLDHVLQQAPGLPEVHLLKANLLLRLRRLGEAGSVTRRASEMGASPGHVHRLYAWLAYELDEPEHARRYYQQALSHDANCRDQELESRLQIDQLTEAALEAADAANRAIEELLESDTFPVEELGTPIWYPGKDDEDDAGDDWWRGGPSEDGENSVSDSSDEEESGPEAR